MDEEVTINMFHSDVEHALEPTVTYIPVTLSSHSQQVKWTEVQNEKDGLSTSGEVIPSGRNMPEIANSTVLQIVTMADDGTSPNATQTFQVNMAPSTDTISLPSHIRMAAGEGFHTAELLTISDKSTEVQDVAQTYLTTDACPQSVPSSPDADAFITQVISRPLKVFREVTAVLSDDLLTAIPGSHSVVFENIQSDFGVQLLSGHTDQGEQEIHISGDLASIMRVQQRLESVCGIVGDSSGPDMNTFNKDQPVSDNTAKPGDDTKADIKPDTKDTGVLCDILLPTVTRRGRIIKPHSKYSNYLRMRPWLEGGDFGEEPVSKRKRKPKISKLTDDPPTAKKTESSLLSDDEEFVDVQAATVGNSVVSTAVDIETAEEETLIDGSDSAAVDTIADSPEEGADEDQFSIGRKIKTKRDYERLAPFKFFCKKCSFRTKRKSHFMNHKRLHDKQLELYRCRKCSFTSLRLSHLRRHEVTHSVQKFTCNLCPYHTDRLKLLQRHKKSKHDPEKLGTQDLQLLSCPRCKYTTKRQFHFERHLRTHPEPPDNSGEDPAAMQKIYQCELCPFSTQRKECLYRHKGNVHSEKRPFLCDLCGKSFKRPDTLVQHKVTHVDREQRNYAFKCQSCNKTFRSQAHLSEHLDSHSNQKTHLCHICGTAFRTRSVQRSHMRTIHYNPRAFQCQHCQKKFNTKYSLNRHARTHLTDMTVDTVSQICEPQDVLGSEVTAGAEQIQVQQVQDVIVPSVGEVFDQTGEAIHQTFIQTADGRPTFLYFSGLTFQDSS